MLSGLLEVALVVEHWEAGIGDDVLVVLLLVVPCPFAFQGWRSSCSVGRLVLLVGSGVAVLRR